MKIRVTLKDPDTMHDSVEAAYKRLEIPDGVLDLEWADICEKRGLDAKDAITEKWMEYGEYLTVEFDTDAGTATVVPNSETS